MDSIPTSFSQHKSPRILHQGLITSEEDIVRLKLFDWNRSYGNPAKFLRGITNWTRKSMTYSVMQCDMHRSPAQNDFPDWKHVGHHEHIGSLYWNWFHAQFSDSPEKELFFSDSPDFSGSITFPSGRRTQFWGDIGRCSAVAFIESMLQMRQGDLWITIPDSSRQIVLEAQIDFFAIWQRQHPLFRTHPNSLETVIQPCLL